MSSSHFMQGLEQCGPMTISALAEQVIGKPITAGNKVFEVVNVRFFLMKEAHQKWFAKSFTVDLVEVAGEQKVPVKLSEDITFSVERSPVYRSKENLQLLGPKIIKTAVTPLELLETVSSRLNFGVD